MKITFTETHMSISSGNSQYRAGDEADLVGGAKLVELGVARAGWGKAKRASRRIKASAIKELSKKHKPMVQSAKSAGKDGAVTVGDVEALVTDD